MKERFVNVFEATLAENRNGEVKNLLITDNNAEFLDDALYALRSWALKNGINLVELDEKDDSWLPEIQSRELFYKLNQPNTVLLVKNYAANHFDTDDVNTPRNFLQDAALNRHYGCGNDFVPSDELPGLLFVVALNDLSEMSWRKNEYSCFTIMHENDDKCVWTNTNFRRHASKMHPVMSRVNKAVYFVSDDETTLHFDVENAFVGHRPLRPVRLYTANERTDIIHTYLENNFPDFHDRVECLILKMGRFDSQERFVLDGARLKKSFPNLGSICCKDMFDIADAKEEICILDPFELGELSFYLAREGDIAMANSFVRDLWALDHKWAKFFREVARDYYRKTEDHPKVDADSAVYNPTGMDYLFRIYLLGWYSSDCSFDEEHNVLVRKHKNSDKALELLPVRLQNCSVDEVAYKLYWDLQHVKNDDNPDYRKFESILSEAERLIPGVVAKMCEKGWLTEDLGEIFVTRTCNMCGKTFNFWDNQEDFCLDRHIGFGSAYDLHRIKLNLCCHCFDKVIDWILPQCKHNPLYLPEKKH